MTDEFYPMWISSARYGGVYEGGPYVLVAGVYNPYETTEAFGGDIPCGEFWERAEREGPVIEIPNPRYTPGHEYEDETIEIYADSGPHPVALFERFEEVKRKRRDSDAREAVNEVIFEYPDLYAAGEDYAVKRHKLGALAAKRVDSNVAADSMRASKMLVQNRYPTECERFHDLADDAQAEVREFVKAETESEYLPPGYDDLGKLFADNDTDEPVEDDPDDDTVRCYACDEDIEELLEPDDVGHPVCPKCDGNPLPPVGGGEDWVEEMTEDDDEDSDATEES